MAEVMTAEQAQEVHTFICEVCEITIETTNEAAFQSGWDYPPFIGEYGVVSPRTCGECGIEKTVWWALITSPTQPPALDARQLAVIERIVAEVPTT